MVEQSDFWKALDELAAVCRLVIDRPRGSQHPRYKDLIYPLDYGYLEGSAAVDGAGIDAWLGSLQPPGIDGLIMSVDLLKRDAEIKLLLGCTDAEKDSILTFMNGAGSQSSQEAVLVDRSSSCLSQQECIGMRELTLRHSVRRFSAQPVADSILQRILQAAHSAPSAHNRQPWRFVILSGIEARETLAEALAVAFRQDLSADSLPPDQVEAQVQRSYQRITQAPAAVVVCLETRLGDPYPDERRQACEHQMGVQSVAMAGENLLLAAAGEGLGGVWMCAPLFAPEAARRALDLPASWDPQGLVLLGYPVSGELELVPHSRLPLAEVVLWK